MWYMYRYIYVYNVKGRIEGSDRGTKQKALSTATCATVFPLTILSLFVFVN